MSVAEDLVAARALIDTPEKWIKGQHTVGQSHCAAGAIMAVKSEDYDRCYQALADVLPEGAGRMVRFYNDDPATTHADILALFDRAIAAARAPHLSKGAAE